MGLRYSLHEKNVFWQFLVNRETILGHWKVAGSNPSSGLGRAACRSVQDSEPKIAPDVWLARCMVASAISEGPAMSWQLVQGVPCPRPETGSIKKPLNPIKEIKRLQTMDGWMDTPFHFITSFR